MPARRQASPRGPSWCVGLFVIYKVVGALRLEHGETQLNNPISLEDLRRIEAVLASVIKELVANPDEVKITMETAGLDSHLLRVTVAASDMGRLVGKQGRTARALRIILGAMSTNLGSRVNLDIRDETLPHQPSSLES